MRAGHARPAAPAAARACRPLARPFSCSGAAAASRATQLRRSRRPAQRPQRTRGTRGAARASGGGAPGGDPDSGPARGAGPLAPGGPGEGGPPDEGDQQAGQLGRRVGLALFGAAAAALVTLTLSSGLSPAALVARLEALVDASGPAGPALYVGTYAVSTTLFFPAALLTLGAGCGPLDPAGACFLRAAGCLGIHLGAHTLLWRPSAPPVLRRCVAQAVAVMAADTAWPLLRLTCMARGS